MENTVIAIEKEKAQAILSYLATRPYSEVYQLIEMLQGCPEAKIGPAPEMTKAEPQTGKKK